MSGDARDPTDEDAKQEHQGSASSSRLSPVHSGSDTQRETPLERLALRGSCVKDGGMAQAMLLVPMRAEQRQLLPRELPRQVQVRVWAAVRRATFRLSPEPWRGHELEQEMLRLQADRKLALNLVERRGLALQRVPAELRDRELVLAAVRSRGRALEFAPPRLQRDREVVLAALTAPGGHKALSFAAAFGQDEEVQAAAKQVRLQQERKRRDEDLPLLDLEPSIQPPAQIIPDDFLCLLHL